MSPSYTQANLNVGVEFNDTTRAQLSVSNLTDDRTEASASQRNRRHRAQAVDSASNDFTVSFKRFLKRSTTKKGRRAALFLFVSYPMRSLSHRLKPTSPAAGAQPSCRRDLPSYRSALLAGSHDH